MQLLLDATRGCAATAVGSCSVPAAVDMARPTGRRVSNSRNSRLRMRCPAGLALLVLVHCSLAPTTLSSSSLSAGGGGDGGGLAAVAGGSSGGGGGGGVDVSAPVLAAGLALAGAASLALGLDHHPLGPMTHVPNVTLLSSVVAPPVSAAAVSSGPWEVSGGCPEAVVRGGGGGGGGVGPAPALPSLGVVVGEAAPIATPSLSPASPTPAPSQSLSSQHTAERPSEGQPPRESPWQEVPAPAVAPSASTLHVVVTATGEVSDLGAVGGDGHIQSSLSGLEAPGSSSSGSDQAVVWDDDTLTTVAGLAATAPVVQDTVRIMASVNRRRAGVVVSDSNDGGDTSLLCASRPATSEAAGGATGRLQTTPRPTAAAGQVRLTQPGQWPPADWADWLLSPLDKITLAGVEQFVWMVWMGSVVALTGLCYYAFSWTFYLVL